MKKITLLLCTLLLAGAGFAQNSLTLPQASQKTSITQTIGITDITVTYHSPGVKERQVWGTMVPMDQVWRAGANENTVITFSDAVQIEGKPLAAGSYGLHMIPTENDWTIIFSKNTSSWGSYFYKEEEDALRVTVSPREHAHTEWLAYRFINPEADKVQLVMNWEKLSVPVEVSVNVHDIVLASFREELRSTPSFTWMGPYQAANYCLQNNINHEEALVWIDQSISTGWGAQVNYTNVSTKAQLLEQMEKGAEAEEAWAQALEVANEQQRYQYGVQLINKNENEGALAFFKESAKLYPDSWMSHAGLGAGYRVTGDLKTALKHYQKAKEGAPAQWKAALETRIKTTEETMLAKKDK